MQTYFGEKRGHGVDIAYLKVFASGLKKEDFIQNDTRNGILLNSREIRRNALYIYIYTIP